MTQKYDIGQISRSWCLNDRLDHSNHTWSSDFGEIIVENKKIWKNVLEILSLYGFFVSSVQTKCPFLPTETAIQENFIQAKIVLKINLTYIQGRARNPKGLQNFQKSMARPVFSCTVDTGVYRCALLVCICRAEKNTIKYQMSNMKPIKYYQPTQYVRYDDN